MGTLTRTAKATLPRSVRYAIRSAAYKAVAPAFRGNQVECPVCGGRWREFVGDYGGSICPGCCSGSRHRMIAVMLKERLLQRGRILHFAPEPGLLKMLRRSAVIDYSPADLDPPSGGYQVDITDIRLPEGFDGVIASHVLEHVLDDRKALSEIHRVLRPGGWALILVPFTAAVTYEDATVTTPKGRQRAFGQWDHVRRYGPDAIDRIREAGFHVEKVRGDCLANWKRYGLIPNEVAHLAVKA